MSRTLRQQLMERLLEGPATVRGLAAELELPVRRIVEDLAHVRRSLREKRLVLEPGQCLACGRVFRKRERLTAPSRCPDCRSEQTTEPRFWIE